MTYALLPFFLFWLSLQVAESFGRMFLFFLTTIKTFLISCVFACAVFFFFYRSFSTPLSRAQSQYLQDNTFESYKQLLVVFAKQHSSTARSLVEEQGMFFSPEGRRDLSNAVKQNDKIKQEIQYWGEKLTLQPTARDVLINLSRLYHWQGDEMRSAQYVEKAQKIDPNHSY